MKAEDWMKKELRNSGRKRRELPVVEKASRWEKSASLGVYACNQFTGHHPAGAAAVVVAKSQKHAARLLNVQLRRQGLPGDADANKMALVLELAPQVIILCDGNH